MEIRRIALIYDDSLRPDTTGGYCCRALADLAQVTHFSRTQLAQIPSSFDLYLCIDDGLDYLLPASLRPSAYWAIDTHLNFARSLRRAQNFDFVFAAQKQGATQLRAAVENLGTGTYLLALRWTRVILSQNYSHE